MLNAPPITPVTTTDRVSRNTQNVTANQRNELVTPLTSVLTSSRRKVSAIATSVRPCRVARLIGRSAAA
jgi:hypothetical protein